MSNRYAWTECRIILLADAVIVKSAGACSYQIHINYMLHAGNASLIYTMKNSSADIHASFCCSVRFQLLVIYARKPVLAEKKYFILKVQGKQNTFCRLFWSYFIYCTLYLKKAYLPIYIFLFFVIEYYFSNLRIYNILLMAGSNVVICRSTQRTAKVNR